MSEPIRNIREFSSKVIGLLGQLAPRHTESPQPTPAERAVVQSTAEMLQRLAYAMEVRNLGGGGQFEMAQATDAAQDIIRNLAGVVIEREVAADPVLNADEIDG